MWVSLHGQSCPALQCNPLFTCAPPCAAHPSPDAAAADVPVNAGQRAAVAGLRGGLSCIHGPPGTGKSTTIFHIIECRVQLKAQVGGAGPEELVGWRGCC